MAKQTVKSLTKQLAGLSKTAKGLGIDTTKADAMVKQTKAQGSKSFSGSSYEKAYVKSKGGGAPVLNAEMIGSTEDFTLPPRDTNSPALDSLGSVVGSTAMVAESPRDKIMGRVVSNIEKLGTKGEFTQDAQEDAGVDDKQKKLDAIEARQMQRDRYYENKTRALEDKGGGLAIGMEAERENLNRNRARELADIAIEKAVALDDYNTAVDIAQRKVDAEFEPLEKEIEYLGQVYNMMQNDLTESEKLQVQEKMDEKKTRTADASETARNVIAELVSAGAYSADKQRVLNQAMQEATTAIEKGQDPAQAISKMQSALVGVKSVQQQQMSLQAAQTYASIRSSNASAALNEYQLNAEKEAQTKRLEGLASGKLLPEDAKVADDIDKEFRGEPIVKEYNIAVAKRGPALEIINNGVNGVQDLLLVYEFMKSIDPTSVVRESEFDNAAKSGNIFAGQYTKFNQGYFGAGGFLPEGVKQSFLSALNSSYETRTNQYMNVKSEFGEKINNRLGIDNGVEFLTDYENAAPIEDTLPINDESDDPLNLLSMAQTVNSKEETRRMLAYTYGG